MNIVFSQAETTSKFGNGSDGANLFKKATGVHSFTVNN